MKNNKSLWIKLFIIILVLVAVAGMYVYKKLEKDKLNNQKNTQAEVENKEEKNKGEKNKEEQNILLEISSVDMDEIKSYGLPFVIDFGSDSCTPCKKMAPVLETLHKEWQERAIVHFVDVWKNTTAADDFPVSVIPTQVFFHADGTPFVPSDELAKEIKFTMYSSKDTNEHLFTIHQGGITEDEMRKIFAEMGVK